MQDKPSPSQIIFENGTEDTNGLLDDGKQKDSESEKDIDIYEPSSPLEPSSSRGELLEDTFTRLDYEHFEEASGSGIHVFTIHATACFPCEKGYEVLLVYSIDQGNIWKEEIMRNNAQEFPGKYSEVTGKFLDYTADIEVDSTNLNELRRNVVFYVCLRTPNFCLKDDRQGSFYNLDTNFNEKRREVH